MPSAKHSRLSARRPVSLRLSVLRRPLQFNNVMVPACVNDVLCSLTHIRNEFVSCRVAACHQSVGCGGRQVVMMPSAVVPPQFVDMTFKSLVNTICGSFGVK